MTINVVVEVGGCHFFVVVLGYEEVARLDRHYGVEAAALADFFFHSLKVANHVVAHGPAVECVVDGARSGQARAEHFAVELLEREVVGGFCAVVEARHVGDFAGNHLQLDV